MKPTTTPIEYLFAIALIALLLATTYSWLASGLLRTTERTATTITSTTHH